VLGDDPRCRCPSQIAHSGIDRRCPRHGGVIPESVGATRVLRSRALLFLARGRGMHWLVVGRLLLRGRTTSSSRSSSSRACSSGGRRALRRHECACDCPAHGQLGRGRRASFCGGGTSPIRIRNRASASARTRRSRRRARSVFTKPPSSRDNAKRESETRPHDRSRCATMCSSRGPFAPPASPPPYWPRAARVMRSASPGLGTAHDG
jgi:hypothetical protein